MHSPMLRSPMLPLRSVVTSTCIAAAPHAGSLMHSTVLTPPTLNTTAHTVNTTTSMKSTPQMNPSRPVTIPLSTFYTEGLRLTFISVSGYPLSFATATAGDDLQALYLIADLLIQVCVGEVHVTRAAGVWVRSQPVQQLRPPPRRVEAALQDA